MRDAARMLSEHREVMAFSSFRGPERREAARVRITFGEPQVPLVNTGTSAATDG